MSEEKEHVPTIEQRAARVIDATINAARADTFETAKRYSDYAEWNLIDLIRAIATKTPDPAPEL